MRAKHEFCDTCPGCRPAMVDTRTGEVVPADHPLMIATNWVWDHETTYAERKAFIDVTHHNKHGPEELRLAVSVMNKIQGVLGTKGTKQ